MNLSEEDKEDITDMVIDSRDIEEDDDLTTAYLKGYTDAEEKYRKRIKELEEENKRYKSLNYLFKVDNQENYINMKKIYNEWLDSIPKQKVKEIFDRLHISDIEPWSSYKVSGDILFDLKDLLEDK